MYLLMQYVEESGASGNLPLDSGSSGVAHRLDNYAGGGPAPNTARAHASAEGNSAGDIELGNTRHDERERATVPEMARGSDG